MNRHKSRYDAQQQQQHQHYRQPHPQQNYGVLQQGQPPNVAHRIPNSGGMRPQMSNRQHVPQQQQQQQQPQQIQGQQVQQQTHVGSVTVQHQGYPHVSTQGHPPHQMYYAATHTQPHHATPQSFIQIPTYMGPTNPGLPLHPLTLQQVYAPRYATTAYYGTQHGHGQAQQTFFSPTAVPQTHQIFAAAPSQHQYISHQQRIGPATNQAVASAPQQLQQAPIVAPSHGGVVTSMSTQHQPQHPHPPQASVPPQNQQAMRLTTEKPQQQEHRKKKILKIVHPETGEAVIDNSATSAASNSTANSDSSSTKGASVTAESAPSSTANSGDKQDSQPSQVAQQSQDVQDIKQKEEPPVITKDESGGGGATVDRNKSSARAEFYQKIAQASDDNNTSTRASSSTSSSSNPNTSAETPTGSSNQEDAQVVEPASADSTPVPSTPTKDKSPSPDPSKQLVVNTPVANTSSDDSKDASLVSISPTPIENYATPRSRDIIASPTLQPTIEKYAEETLEEEDISTEDGAQQEDTHENEAVVEPEPVKQNNIEEASDLVNEEIGVDSELSDSVKPEESETGDDLAVEDTGSVPEEESQPNGHVPLEEGELGDEDDLTVADSGQDGPEDTTNSAKGKIKYDRNTLLMIANQTNINEFKVADKGLPDLARDNLNNHIKYPMGKNSPGGGPRDYGRIRGMPNQGNKPLPPHGNMHNMRMMGMGMGGITWGGLAVPPPPPRVTPKVQLTLQREEVKLHKAENAWKPSTLKRGATGDQNATDEESLITDSIVKKTRGILNKLTPDNFEKLVTKFMALPLEDKDERISSVISVVFEKAIDEPSFSTAYARMVNTVCKTSQETSKKFRKQILDQCQKEFSNSSTDEEEIKKVEQKLAETTDDGTREQLKLELEEKKYLSRRRSLGNVRFIGELYKLQMLTPKIMVECVQMLLYTPDDENLECLCKLLTTVGQRLDMQLKVLEDQALRGEKPKFAPEQKWMDRTFTNLQKLSDDKKLSSRIRFAILDVVELRGNDWKPRRDANAPKTIEEVRQEAIRQEMEEKRQINSLPPVQNSYGGGGDRDHRSSGGGGGSGRLPSSQPPKKGANDWTTTKANRFMANNSKKPDQMGSGGNPTFMPSWGGTNNWEQKSQSRPTGSSQPSKPPYNLPPRLLNSRFQNLAQDEGHNRSSYKSMPNSSDIGNYRDQHSSYSSSQSHSAAPTPTSPPPSVTSSAENSRPVSPKEPAHADTGETVKNIFQEYLSCKKFDDTLDWIKKRFSGNKIDEFIEEMCRQVAEMSKQAEQQCAGSLIRLLIKNKEIPKDAVIRLMAQGVMQDLPDILIDSPMATSYLAQFLVEVFVEERDLDWLVQCGSTLIDSEEGDFAWRQLAVNSIKLLKLRKNEEIVQTAFKHTERKNVIPTEEIPWLQDKSLDSLADQMVKVLGPKINSETSDEAAKIFQEHSWDVREDLTARALTEAICTLTWDPETGNWKSDDVRKLLPLLALPNQKMLPVVWKQVEDFAKRKSIDKKEAEGIWSIMYSMNMMTTD